MVKYHIFQSKSGHEHTLKIGIGKRQDETAILELQEKVHQHMAKKELYFCLTEEEVWESLRHDYFFNAFDGDRLVAFSLLISPRDTPRNLGYSMNYSKEVLLDCATCDGTVVDPSFRGLGLQYFFTETRYRVAGHLGAKIVLAAVSPENPHSYRNLLRHGFQIVGKKPIYGGHHERYILRRDVHVEEDCAVNS